MLSFDYQPIHYIENQPRYRHPIGGLGSFFPPVRCESAYRRKQKPQRHYHDRPKHISRSQTIGDFFNLLDIAPQKLKPEVTSKVVENKDAFHIDVKKNNTTNDFRSYLIRYRDDHTNVDVIIESIDDDFQKVYRFQKSDIDIKNVKWKTTRNALVVEIPKKTHDFVLVPSVPSGIENKTKNRKIPQETNSLMKDHHETHIPAAPVSSKQDQLKPQPESSKRCRVISIPIEFSESQQDFKLNNRKPSVSSSSTQSLKSSPETASLSSDEFSLDSLLDSNSAVEGTKSSKLPKISRKVSIEEVEDESFMDLD